jgi:hypothetical protein
MWKERPYLPIIILFALIGLACNAFAGNVEPGFDPPTTVDPTGEQVENGDEPALAPTATLPGDADDEEESGEGQPRVTTLVDLNVRSGPGVAYEIVDFLLQGSRADIIGQNEEGTWWRIACPDEEETAECWVSGGSQFTIASNVDDVTVAEAPPLPTPIPPAPEAGVALLVYVDNGRLYLSRLNLSQDPPAASSPIQLVDDTQVTDIAIAPDGRRVAYLNGRDGPISLKIVNIDGRGERTLVEATDLELPDGYDETEWEPRLRQIQWLANSQAVAFNTTLINLIGLGTGPQEDFWTVDLEGEMDQIFAPGLGGGYFTISPGGTILLSRDTEIVRAGLDGRVQSLISFDFINTASEFIYYPTPQWSRDGSVAYVGIPSAEPFGPNPQTHLWRIPAAGGATRLGSIPENLLFNDLYWNDSGSHLAYTLPIDEPNSPTPRLMVASGSGQLGPEGLPYTTDGPLRLHGWSSNNQNFLFSGIGYFAIGRPLADPVTVPLPANSRVGEGHWLSGDHYVVSVQPGGSGNWLLVSGNLLGNTTSLVSNLSSEEPLVALWTR